MGIEYIIVNLDKKEYLDFDKLGFGTKILATTSQPIASVLTWLLIEPDGYLEPSPAMLGRWAGDRVEIIGDETRGRERQREARKEFADITVEALAAFASGTNATELKAMGLIDKDGKVVLDFTERESVAQYWKRTWEENAKPLNGFMVEWEKIEEALRNGSATDVKGLRSPRTGGPLRIQYIHPEGAPAYFRVSDPPERMIDQLLAPNRPEWVDVLGEDFLTEPGAAEQGTRSNPRSAPKWGS